MSAIGGAILWVAGPSSAAGESIPVPPFTTTVNIDGQALRITVSGTAVTPAAPYQQKPIQVNLQVDLSDIQAHVTDLLRAHVNQSNHCGLRLSVEHAELTPGAPGSPDALLTANIHGEKYACVKALGRRMITKLIAGDGKVEVRLTPTIENSDTLRLSGEVVSVEAEGAMGELLRTEPAGSWIREKMCDALANTLEKSLGKLKAEMPPAVRGLAVIRSARFAGLGSGRLGLGLSAELRISPDMAQMMIQALKEQAR